MKVSLAGKPAETLMGASLFSGTALEEPFSGDPRGRRCGWSVAALIPDGAGLWRGHTGLFGPLEGRRQTVPRAELL
eukprot:871471-Pyramimonas_sp.AAC.1